MTIIRDVVMKNEQTNHTFWAFLQINLSASHQDTES